MGDRYLQPTDDCTPLPPPPPPFHPGNKTNKQTNKIQQANKPTNTVQDYVATTDYIVSIYTIRHSDLSRKCVCGLWLRLRQRGREKEARRTHKRRSAPRAVTAKISLSPPPPPPRPALPSPSVFHELCEKQPQAHVVETNDSIKNMLISLDETVK